MADSCRVDGLIVEAVLSRDKVVPAQAYWLQVRRKGPSGIVAAARAALVDRPQVWRYRLDVMPDAAMAGLTIEISRRPLKRGGTDVGVRLLDKRGKLIAALATIHGKLTVRVHGQTAKSTAKALFAPVPRLGVPLILWAVFELMPAYRVQLEGEFSGTALIRMTPDYTSMRGLQPMKLGVSKQNLLPSVVEVVDLKGRPTARLLWIKPRHQGRRTVAGGLRIRTMKRTKPLDFSLDSYKSGRHCGARFGAKALADR